MEFKIDLHTHFIEGNFSAKEIINQLEKNNIQGICLTEHSKFFIDESLWEKAQRIVKEIKKAKFFASVGIELYTPNTDILIYGDFYLKDLKDKNNNFFWRLEDIFTKIPRDKICLIWAHPTRRIIGFSEKHKEYILNNVEGIESINGMNEERKSKANQQIYSLLGEDVKKLVQVGGSDAHCAENIGKCFTVFNKKIKINYDLVKEIKNKKVKPAENFNKQFTKVSI